MSQKSTDVSGASLAIEIVGYLWVCKYDLPGRPTGRTAHGIGAAGPRRHWVNFAMFDQRNYRDAQLVLRVRGNHDQLGGELRLREGLIELDSVRGIYTRLHGTGSFSELENSPASQPDVRYFNDLVQSFTAFADLCPGVVLNRSPGMATNNSKPLQCQLIAECGFKIAGTLITNNPVRAVEFIARMHSAGARVIYKSASSVRSIVREVTETDMPKLEKLRICPVQFQQRVPVIYYRVPVIGEDVFPTRIETSGVDYRCSSRDGGDTSLVNVDLDAAIARQCVRLAAHVGIAIAGIDLRRTPEGDWFCFEVNPSPAYSYYEDQTGQEISRAVAMALASHQE